MQAQATDNLVSMLKKKDEAVQYPASWDYVRKNKDAYLLRMEEAGSYEFKAIAECSKKCWKTSATSSVVNV